MLNENSDNLQIKGNPTYINIVKYLFFLLLLGTLSFGRPFSALHINTPFLPVFITELVLLFSLPLIMINCKDIFKKLPKGFTVLILVYFLFGCCHLAFGIVNKNMFALRDITLCGYIMFLPVTLIYFYGTRNLRLFLNILFISNIVALIAGFCLIHEIAFSQSFYDFINQTKFTNLGLYYCIFVSLFISFYDNLKTEKDRLLAMFLLSANLYMIVMSCVKAVWLAFVVLAIFLLLAFRKKIIKLFVKLSPVLILTALLFTGLEFVLTHEQELLGETEGLVIFVHDYVLGEKTVDYEWSDEPLKSEDLNNSVKASLGNIIWRLSIWKQSIKFAFDSPLIGKGFGVYPDYAVWGFATPKTFGVNSGVTPAHNHLVSIFYKTGIVGLGLFLYINFYVFFYGIKQIKNCKSEFTKSFLIGSLGAFIYWHGLAFFFDIIDSPPTSIFLWIIISLIFNSIAIDKNTNEHLSTN